MVGEMALIYSLQSGADGCVASCVCYLNARLTSILCSIFSAVIEHTNRVIYLEDNDVAAVGPDGCTSACHSPFQLLLFSIVLHPFDRGLTE